jgi:hypothetical protein
MAFSSSAEAAGGGNVYGQLQRGRWLCHKFFSVLMVAHLQLDPSQISGTDGPNFAERWGEEPTMIGCVSLERSRCACWLGLG